MISLGEPEDSEDTETRRRNERNDDQEGDSGASSQLEWEVVAQPRIKREEESARSQAAHREIYSQNCLNVASVNVARTLFDGFPSLSHA